MGLISFFGFNSNAEDNVDLNQKKALEVISNTNSSVTNAFAAFNQLESFKGDPHFWLTIAADQRYDPDRRRRCVKHFFEHFTLVGTQLTDLVQLMNTNVNFISYDHIQKWYRDGVLTGWQPEAVQKGKSSFEIPILRNEGGHYHLDILLSFKEDVKLSDLIMILKNSNVGSKPSMQMTIAACGVWDSDEAEKRLPGYSAVPGAW